MFKLHPINCYLNLPGREVVISLKQGGYCRVTLSLPSSDMRQEGMIESLLEPRNFFKLEKWKLRSDSLDRLRCLNFSLAARFLSGSANSDEI